jgi:hypothetical protein
MSTRQRRHSEADGLSVATAVSFERKFQSLGRDAAALRYRVRISQ